MHDHQPEDKKSNGAQQAKVHEGAFPRPSIVRSPVALREKPYEAAFHSVYGRLALEAGVLEKDRLSARPLLNELLAQPEPRRKVLLRNSKRFATWGLAEQVLSRAHQACEQDPGQAAQLAKLSHAILENLSGKQGSRLANDLAGRAWAYLATCHRLAGETGQARRAFRKAESLLVSGTGDPFEWVHILDLRTAHEVETGNFDLALELLEQTIHLYQRIEDSQLLARALLRRARLAALAGRGEEAQKDLRDAEAAVQESDNSGLQVVILRTRAELLAHAGNAEAAWALLPSVRRRTLQSGDREALLILRRLDGRLADSLGYQIRAERSLTTLYNARLGHSPSHAGARALAGAFLDLAIFYLRHQKPEEAASLSTEFLPLITPGTLPETVRKPLVKLVYSLREGLASLDMARQARRGFLEATAAYPESTSKYQHFISNAFSEKSILRLWTLQTVE